MPSSSDRVARSLEAVVWKVDAAMRLGMCISPRDRRLAFWGWAMAVHMLHGERVVEAFAEARSAQERDPRSYLARIREAGALARLGRSSDVPAPLRRARQLWPRLTMDEVRRTHGRRVAVDVAPFWNTAVE